MDQTFLILLINFVIFFSFFLCKLKNSLLIFLEDRQKDIQHVMAQARLKHQNAMDEYEQIKKCIEDIEIQIVALEEQTKAQIALIEANFKVKTSHHIKMKQEQGMEHLNRLQFKLQNDLYDFIGQKIMDEVLLRAQLHDATHSWNTYTKEAFHMLETTHSFTA